MVLIGGVARTFDLNMVPEAVNEKLEPMLFSYSFILPSTPVKYVINVVV